MPATVHVVARFVAKAGKEDALKAVLSALIAPTRREIACYQYDLLASPTDPRDFCFVERWDSDRSLDLHLDTDHVRHMLAQVEGLLEAPPDIRRYRIV
ncbi:MAG: antibiotic biosynthesis monooxygenase [Acidobacteria bacterium]|nr:antibiotic biosynthesis monooxygenase [Acidobacteriota bacterium]